MPDGKTPNDGQYLENMIEEAKRRADAMAFEERQKIAEREAEQDD